MENVIQVPNIEILMPLSRLESVSEVLDELEKHNLQNAPWAAFPYKPSVQFSIAYSGAFIFLKYYVSEKHIRAVNATINGSVWEDSCVEFFVSFDDLGYYNFECNCIGTCLMGFGKERNTRQRLPEEVLKNIKFDVQITNDTGNNTFNWVLTAAIPLSVFIHHPNLSLKGKTCRANLYKCGDLLPEPHFVAWSNIETEKPDFHRPEFFGSLIFKP